MKSGSEEKKSRVDRKKNERRRGSVLPGRDVCREEMCSPKKTSGERVENRGGVKASVLCRRPKAPEVRKGEPREWRKNLRREEKIGGNTTRDDH